MGLPFFYRDRTEQYPQVQVSRKVYPLNVKRYTMKTSDPEYSVMIKRLDRQCGLMLDLAGECISDHKRIVDCKKYEERVKDMEDDRNSAGPVIGHVAELINHCAQLIGKDIVGREVAKALRPTLKKMGVEIEV